MARNFWKTVGITLVIMVLALSCFGCKKSEDEQPANNQTDTSVVEVPRFDDPQQKPVRIKIDKINVDEAIDPVGLNGKEMATPPGPVGVSWFQSDYYASPGWSGNALITGHNYFNSVPGTFVDLNKLVVGDKVEFTYEDGSKGYFEVTSTDRYLATDDEGLDKVMAQSSLARTTIITCDGDKLSGGGYSHRFVVICEAKEHIGANGEKLTTEAPAEDSLR